MNKQELQLLNDIQLLIEERNALKADKEALIDALRHTVGNCNNCRNNTQRHCASWLGRAVDCVTCTDACVCKVCRNGSHFEWIGRSPRGKHAVKEHPSDDMPVGIRAAMEEDKKKKAR